MNHQGTRELKTCRLLLRRVKPGDGEEIYRNYASDDDVTRFLSWQTHASPNVSEEVVLLWANHYEDPHFYQWMIVPDETGEIIGSISVVHEEESTKSLEIGYCIGKAYWHKGYMSEALRAVIAFLFDEVGALRLIARHDPENPRSGRVMKACGMQYEGTLRKSILSNRGITDACYYSILKEDIRK